MAALPLPSPLLQEADIFLATATAMLDAAVLVVESDRIEQTGLLHDQRGEIVALLGRYQRFKHVRVFDPIINEGSSARKIVARGMKTDCILMGECVSRYHARWEHADLAASWPSYRSDMLETVATLEAHLTSERRAIGQLVAIDDLYASIDGATPSEEAWPAAVDN